MRGYTLAGVLAVALSAFAFFGVIRDQSLLLGSGRAQGLFKDPNVYGPYLVPMLLFALAAIAGESAARLSLPARAGGLRDLRDGLVLELFARGMDRRWGGDPVLLWPSDGLGNNHSTDFERPLVLDPVCGRACRAVVFIGASSSTPMGRMLAVRIGDSGLQNYDATRFETHRRAFDTALEQPLGVWSGAVRVVVSARDAQHVPSHSHRERHPGLLGPVRILPPFAPARRERSSDPCRQVASRSVCPGERMPSRDLRQRSGN